MRLLVTFRNGNAREFEIDGPDSWDFHNADNDVSCVWVYIIKRGNDEMRVWYPADTVLSVEELPDGN